VPTKQYLGAGPSPDALWGLSLPNFFSNKPKFFFGKPQITGARGTVGHHQKNRKHDTQRAEGTSQVLQDLLTNMVKKSSTTLLQLSVGEKFSINFFSDVSALEMQI